MHAVAHLPRNLEAIHQLAVLKLAVTLGNTVSSIDCILERRPRGRFFPFATNMTARCAAKLCPCSLGRVAITQEHAYAALPVAGRPESVCCAPC